MSFLSDPTSSNIVKGNGTVILQIILNKPAVCTFKRWRLTLNSEATVRETVIYCPKSLKSKLYTILSLHTGPVFQLCQHWNLRPSFKNNILKNNLQFATLALYTSAASQNHQILFYLCFGPALWSHRVREDERENQMIATKLCLYLSQLGAAVRRFSYAELSV